MIKIFYEVKKISQELIEIFERLKEKKIAWENNSNIVINLLIKKKSMERNVKSIFLYVFFRTKISESIFWNNNSIFPLNFFRTVFSKKDIKFLNLYYQVLIDHFDRINLKLYECSTKSMKGFLNEIKIKKDFNLIFKKKKKKVFKNGSRIFLRSTEIRQFSEGNFFFKLKLK